MTRDEVPDAEPVTGAGVVQMAEIESRAVAARLRGLSAEMASLGPSVEAALAAVSRPAFSKTDGGAQAFHSYAGWRRQLLAAIGRLASDPDRTADSLIHAHEGIRQADADAGSEIGRLHG
ncbi:MAG: hypothetical protein ACRCYQ_08555 [Nocardioides sp.]